MATFIELPIETYSGPVDPDWCPGCGDFGVLKAVKMAAGKAGVAPKDLVVISGIGCSSNLPGYVHAYGVHSLHGRAVAVATGVRLANIDLKVVITGGDGDGYGIGIGHFIHAMRRNLDLTYVARGFSGDPNHMADLIAGGIQHKGFALIDAFSPCVTYNKLNTYPWFKKRVYKLEEDRAYNSTNVRAALEKSFEWGDRIPIGLF